MRLLKVSSVAKKLNVSRGKIYKMINKNKIPHVNIDGCIRVPEELLEEMIYHQIKGKQDEKIEDQNSVLFGGGAARRQK
ncbi:MAG: helix-turn-helix domain-containing protein [Firmicutes bacterium]|nr:helix-turn-helix domain-containing protein [Bacillota bacterium]